MGYLDQYVNVDETQTIRDFLRSAFAADFEKEAKLLHYMVNMLKHWMMSYLKKPVNYKINWIKVPSIKWTH